MTKRRGRTACWRVLAVAAVACLAAWAADGDATKPAALPPLKVNKARRRCLSDGPKKKRPQSRARRPHADNGACFVCHGNYQEESLADRTRRRTSAA